MEKFNFKKKRGDAKQCIVHVCFSCFSFKCHQYILIFFCDIFSVSLTCHSLVFSYITSDISIAVIMGLFWSFLWLLPNCRKVFQHFKSVVCKLEETSLFMSETQYIASKCVSYFIINIEIQYPCFRWLWIWTSNS